MENKELESNIDHYLPDMTKDSIPQSGGPGSFIASNHLTNSNRSDYFPYRYADKNRSK